MYFIIFRIKSILLVTKQKRETYSKQVLQNGTKLNPRLLIKNQ